MSNDDLDDCVSGTLIKVFSYLKQYDSEKSSVKTWVLVIAKHYVIDMWRSNTVATSGTSTISLSTNTTFDNSGNYVTSNNTDNLAFTANSTFTSCNNDFENCSSINFISQQISATDYTLLNMKYVQGYDYNEIGKEFNVTSSTISNRVNYIKTKLKRDNPEMIYE